MDLFSFKKPPKALDLTAYATDANKGTADGAHIFELNHLHKPSLSMLWKEGLTAYRTAQEKFLNDQRIFKAFYNGAYTEAFPNSDERESKKNIIAQNKNLKASAQDNHHVIVATLNGQVVGGRIVDSLHIEAEHLDKKAFGNKENATVGFSEFRVVGAEFRGQKIGDDLTYKGTQIVQEAATKKGMNLVAEVGEMNNWKYHRDNPEETLKENITRMTAGHYQSQWGAVAVEKKDGFQYTQTALEAGKSPVNLDMLFRRPPSGKGKEREPPSELAPKFIARVVYKMQQKTMNVANPEQNPQYIEMKAALDARNGQPMPLNRMRDHVMKTFGTYGNSDEIRETRQVMRDLQKADTKGTDWPVIPSPGPSRTGSINLAGVSHESKGAGSGNITPKRTSIIIK